MRVVPCDAVQRFHQLQHANLQPGLLSQLARQRLFQRLAYFHYPARQRPPTFQRLSRALDQQHGARAHHHAAHPHHRTVRVLPTHTHLLAAHHRLHHLVEQAHPAPHVLH